MTDREALESKWQDNERELYRLYLSGSLDRAAWQARIDALEEEQERITRELGRDDATT